MSGTTEKTVAPTIISPKSSPSKKEVDAATQALNYFAQGKRHLLVNDINSAVNSLQEACHMLAEQHGETAPECGDAFFYYGRALLEMARIESGVIGNALDGEEGSTDDESQDGESQDGESQDGESQDGESQDGESQEGDSQDGDSHDGDSQDGESQKEGDELEDDQEGGEEDKEAFGVEEKEGEGEKTEEEEEDVSNLQLSWEMLELAKIIYQRQEDGNKAMSLKTAQVFLKLGEVGLESENYPHSIEDFQSCLKLQESHMDTDDRCLAETHYQLGVAHSFSDDFDKSIESFTKAAKIIGYRITNLEKMKIEKEGWTEEQKKRHVETCEDPFYTEEAEIQELNNLLPEIKEKIVDMEEMKKDSKDKINKVKKDLGVASAIGGPLSKEVESTSNAFGSSSSTTSEAKPIATTMIRKKRKPDNESEEDDASKKIKAANGEAKPNENGIKNGHSSAKMNAAVEESMSDELKKRAVEDNENQPKEL